MHEKNDKNISTGCFGNVFRKFSGYIHFRRICIP